MRYRSFYCTTSAGETHEEKAREEGEWEIHHEVASDRALMNPKHTWRPLFNAKTCLFSGTMRDRFLLDSRILDKRLVTWIPQTKGDNRSEGSQQGSARSRGDSAIKSLPNFPMPSVPMLPFCFPHNPDRGHPC